MVDGATDTFDGVVPSTVLMNSQSDTVVSLLYDIGSETVPDNEEISIVFELDLPEGCRGNKVVKSPIRWSKSGYKLCKVPAIEEYAAPLAYIVGSASIVAKVSVMRAGRQMHPVKRTIEYKFCTLISPFYK